MAYRSSFICEKKTPLISGVFPVQVIVLFVAAIARMDVAPCTIYGQSATVYCSVI